MHDSADFSRSLGSAHQPHLAAGGHASQNTFAPSIEPLRSKRLGSPIPEMPSVLVVDDSRTVCADVRSILEQAGFAVTTRGTKAAALAALASRTFSLALLDTFLPDGSGLEILQHMRATPALMRVPVIMLSSESAVLERIGSMRGGADECISKPYNGAYLAATARQLVDSRAPSISRGAPRALSCGKILVVETNNAYERRLSTALRDEGHDVVSTSSVDVALDLVKTLKLDGAVIDAHTLGPKGIELCRQLRRNPANNFTSVILLASQVNMSHVQRAGLTAGADEVIVKRQYLPPIQEALQKLLQRKRPAPFDRT